ncbi:MAG: hypothetical protein ACHQII_06865 [Bacteroidia bacterium]
MKNKISFKTRLQLAYSAFMLQSHTEVEFQPMALAAAIVGHPDCDNSRRKSKCKNTATRCVTNKTIEIKVSEGRCYHVCDECAKEAIEKNDQEDFS